MIIVYYNPVLLEREH